MAIISYQIRNLKPLTHIGFTATNCANCMLLFFIYIIIYKDVPDVIHFIGIQLIYRLKQQYISRHKGLIPNKT